VVRGAPRSADGVCITSRALTEDGALWVRDIPVNVQDRRAISRIHLCCDWLSAAEEKGEAESIRWHFGETFCANKATEITEDTE
jgi:hypothetical protein